MSWINLFLVALGGAIGSVARWGTAVVIGDRFGSALVWPWPTFTVNVVGSFLIGLIAALAAGGAISPATRLFLAVGIMGGFTTFSSFSLDVLANLESGRGGLALAYVLASVVLGVLATFGGFALGRAFR
jgi:CrcB protein